MAFAIAVKTLIALAGAYFLVRAIARRFARSRDGARPLDPGVTRGLRVGALCLAGFIGGLVLLPLRQAMGWPTWVGAAGEKVVLAAMVLGFPLAAWLGWRVFDEEFEIPRVQAGSDRGDRDRVT